MNRQSSRNVRARPAAPPSSAAVWETPLAKWIGPAIIVAAALLMLGSTWGRWADPLVDFGRELYVPWQLNEGQVLYRDVAYFNGPLSPYFNALVFRLGGTSLRSVVLANVALLGILLSLVYLVLVRVGSRASALLGTLTVVLLFAFQNINPTFNYLAPYSHEMTHGLVLSWAALLFLGRFVDRPGPLAATACGICVGLVFLTKPEFLVAILPAIALGLLLALWADRVALRQWLAAGGAFISGMLLPPAIALLLLALAMPLGDAIQGTIGGLRWVFDTSVPSLHFYRNALGTLDLNYSLWRMLLAGTWYALLIALPAIVGCFWRRTSRLQLATAAGIFVALFAGLFALEKSIPWWDALRPLPVLLALITGALGVAYYREPQPEARKKWVVPCALSLFALLLLAKIALNVRLDSYGFGLAMPATVVLIVACWDWLPRWIERCGGTGLLVRGAFFAVAAAYGVAVFQVTGAIMHNRAVPVGEGPDQMRAGDRARDVNDALKMIGDRIPADGTLVVLPEGIMLNYLSRRTNPTSYISFLPVEVQLFGEAAMLDAFGRHPPDFVLWRNEGLSFYDVKSFGDGYAESLAKWIRANYRLVEQRKARAGYTMSLLKRDEAAATK